MTPQELAERFGTPAYAYELGAVRRAHTLLDAALPSTSELYYTLKANPHPRVVEVLAREGCGAEVSSGGELAIALANGVEAKRIIYTGPAKTYAEIAHALAAGVGWMSVESLTELACVDAAAGAAGRPARCLLRVNPQGDLRAAGLAMMGDASQFGVDASQILANPAAFKFPDAELRGMHLYVGSNIESKDALLNAFELALGDLPALIEALDMDVEVLDLGGGFAHPYARAGEPDDLAGMAEPLAELIRSTLDAVASSAQPRIIFESGRYLAAACGTLLTTVRDVKWSRGRRFIVLDSGVNHLGGMHGLRRLRQLRPEVVTTQAKGKPEPADVVGPLCTPLDAWGRDLDLPQIEPGEVLAVPNVGAYGLTASLVAFLGRELPVEVVLDRGEVVEATRLSLVREAAPKGPHDRSALSRGGDYVYG